MRSEPQAISPLRKMRRGNHTIANLEQEPRLLVDRLGSLPGAGGGYHPHVALPHLPEPLRVLGRRAGDSIQSLGPGRSEAIGPIHPGISRDGFRNFRLGTKRRLAICGPDAAGLGSRRHHRFRNRLLTTVYLSLGKAAKTPSQAPRGSPSRCAQHGGRPGCDFLRQAFSVCSRHGP